MHRIQQTSEKTLISKTKQKDTLRGYVLISTMEFSYFFLQNEKLEAKRVGKRGRAGDPDFSGHFFCALP